MDLPTMSSREKIWACVVLVFVNLLPYLSRILGGWDWIAQYSPDPGHEVLGLVFFHAFYSAPALPVIQGISRARASRLPWLLPLIVVTMLMVFLNHDYDLASDAQAAIGLIVFPVFTMAVGFLGLGFGLLLQRRIRPE
jgi:hypothetical protein